MAILAGIDEAGLGPVLGPLVVSTVVFDVPEQKLSASMWSVLSSAVCRKPSARAGKVAIADSKKLFSRSRRNALEHLERGVLAALATRSCWPGSLRELLAAVAPDAAQEMRRYPWYTAGDVSLPTCTDPTDLRLAGNSVRAALQQAGMRLAGVRCEPVFVERFNRHVAATNNKATMLFDVTSRLLVWLWRKSSPGLLRIYVDRQGGRVRYLPSLQRVFEGCQFKVIDENERFSAYSITGAKRQAQICFLTGGESRHLPIALASMTSKYLRELFMELFNGFWAARVPGLAATAGYYTDGRRFYRQIHPAARKLGIDRQLIYRCR